MLLLLAGTTLEATGNAAVPAALKSDTAPARVGLGLLGTGLLFGYSLFVNLSPLDWGRLLGAYVATYFVVAQVTNYVAFKAAPTLPVLVGGALIVGGAVVTLWRV